MLTAHQVTKAYGADTILNEITFSINKGEKVALIGPNGCGKTTLLRILSREEQPDSGHVSTRPTNLRIGYLPQHFEHDNHGTIQALIRQALGDSETLDAELSRLAELLAKQPDNASIQTAYDQVLFKLECAKDQDSGESSLILENLGLNQIPGDQLVDTLSGGQKTRLSLAMILLSDPEILLLDEPTNHLDITMLEWLEQWIAGFPGGVLIVSHDRTFLDHTVERVLDLNPETHTLRSYPGNYSSYTEQYLAEVKRIWEEYRDQENEIRRMRQDIARTKEQALWVEKTTTSRQPGVRRIAKKVARKAKSREKRLGRYLDSDERVEKPKQSWQMKLEFENLPESGKDVLRLDNLSVGYTGSSPLIKNLNLQIRSGERIILTGPNGCGKTTLLRTVAGQTPPLSGLFQLGSGVRLGYMTQEQELLNPDDCALEIIQRHAAMNETDVRSFLHFFLFSGDDALRPSQALSFGERSRLSLAMLVAQGCNFLLLDEPINHLDIPSRERFEQALSNFEGTILAVVHDRYFIQRFATRVWTVQDKRIRTDILSPDM